MMQNMMVNVGGVMVLYCNTTIVYSFNNIHKLSWVIFVD